LDLVGPDDANSEELARAVAHAAKLVPRRSEFDGLRRRASRPWREARRECVGHTRLTSDKARGVRNKPRTIKFTASRY
jgi:hypothetical protein